MIVSVWIFAGSVGCQEVYIVENIPNGQEDRGGQSEGGLKQRVSCVQHTFFAIGVLYATFVSFS